MVIHIEPLRGFFCAILKELSTNGYIVGLDGFSVLQFQSASFSQNLYAVAWYRNHLVIMSASALTKVSDVYSYDFSTATSQAYGSNEVSLGGGKFGLFGGDMNSNGTIDEFDLSEQWNANAGIKGYFSGDANMDGQVDNKDKNDIWFGNNGESLQIP